MAYTLSVIVPCYNEAPRLADSLAQIQEFLSRSTVFDEGDVEWIFVDDGSVDDTAAILARHAAVHAHVRYVTLPRNQGKGAAVRAGDRIARAEIRAFTDSDLASPLSALEELPRSFAECQPDLVLASRHTPWSRVADRQPWARFVGGRLFSFFMAHCHRSAFTDTQCGLKAWSAGFSARVVQQLEDPGWSFDLEIISRAEARQAKILELPIVWSDREGSKVRALIDGPRMVWRGLRYYFKYSPRTLTVATLLTCALCILAATRWRNDFVIYYDAWLKTRLLDLADLYTPERESQGGYYYSPLFAVLGAPITFVSPVVATIVHVAVQFGLVSTSLILLKRWTRYQLGRVSLSVVLWVTVLLLFLNTLMGQFENGNVSLLIFFLCLLSGYTYLFRRKLLSASLLGLAINVKIFPVFLLGFAILQRDRRFLTYCVGVLLFLTVAPVLYLGWDINWQLHREFLSALARYGAQNDYARVEYQSLPSALFRLATHVEADAQLALRLGQLVVVGAATAVWWTFRKRMRSEWIIVFSFFLAFTAQFVPSSWVHHMGFYYAPLVLLTLQGWAEQRRWPYAATFVAFFAAYALSAQGVVGRAVNDFLEYWSVPTVGIWIFLAGAYAHWKNTPPAAECPFVRRELAHLAPGA